MGLRDGPANKGCHGTEAAATLASAKATRVIASEPCQFTARNALIGCRAECPDVLRNRTQRPYPIAFRRGWLSGVGGSLAPVVVLQAHDVIEFGG